MSTISAGTTSGTALVSTGNTAGTLVFQTNGTTTALTLGTDQSATFVGAVTAPSFSGTSSTATNLAGGFAGNVPYQSAPGTTGMVAAGSSGQLLQSNGTSAPTWVTPSFGAMVLAASATASSSSEIVFTSLSSSYRAYMLEYDSVYVSSNGEGITCRVSTDNGGSYLTSGYTRALVKYSSAGGSIAVNGSSGDSLFYIGSLDGFSNSSSNTGSGILYFFAPNTGSSPFCITEHTVTRNTSSVNEFVTGSMFNTSTTAINAFKLYTGVGTITAGNFRLYGLVNA